MRTPLRPAWSALRVWGSAAAYRELYHRVGRVDYVGASIEKRGGRVRSDGGVYRYYAGPRRVYARGVCVRWTGYVSISEGLGDGFVSRWGHCR